MSPNSQTPRRVLWVLPDLAGGGAERAIATLLPHLNPVEIEAHLCLFRAQGVFLDQIQGVIPVHNLAVNGRSDPRLIWRLQWLIRQLQPHATIGVLRTCGVLTAVAHRLAGRPGRSLINEQTHPSSEMSSYGRSRLRFWLLTRAYRVADQVLAISDDIRRDLNKSFGLSAARTYVIPNPVDDDAVRRLAQAAVPHPWFAEKGYLTVVSTGRLHHVKGYDILLDAFAQIRALGLQVRLIIVGDGPQKEALKKQIHRLDLADVVALVGFQKNPYAYMARADLFVLASRYEGFGIVLAEAQTLGVPVLATDCPGGPREILDGGRAGSLVPADDPAALSQAMTQLLTDEAWRQQLARKGQIKASRFSVSSVAAFYTTYLQEITG